MTDPILVLGLGNVLCADEGFGPRCIQVMEKTYRFPEHVRLVDGGTRGIALLDEMEGVARMLIFDAVDYGLEPGSLRRIEADEIPRFIATGKLSMHQTGFQDVLAYAQISGALPEDIRLIGVQPLLLEDFRGALSESVEATIPAAISLALEVLASWNVRPLAR